MDPIRYIKEGTISDLGEILKEGWYFYNEVWSDFAGGPYETEELAREALAEYISIFL